MQACSQHEVVTGFLDVIRSLKATVGELDIVFIQYRTDTGPVSDLNQEGILAPCGPFAGVCILLRHEPLYHGFEEILK